MSNFVEKNRSFYFLWGVLLLALSLIMTPLFVFPAQAAENTNIQMKITGFTKTDLTNKPLDGGLTVHDLARLDVAWDATQANPQPGDSFSIQLPPAFESRDSTAAVDLIHDKIKVGECATTLSSVVCTLNEKIRGKVDIKGTFFVSLLAKSTTQTTEVPFTFNGKETANVPLPASKAIVAKPALGYENLKFGKSTVPLSDKTRELVWTVNLGSDVIQKATGGAVLDGVNPRSFAVRDELGDGHKFDTNLSTVYLMIGDSAKQLRPKPLILVYANGTKNPEAAAFGDFSVNAVFESDKVARFTLSGPFQAETNYHLIYSSKPTSENGFVEKDVTYSNAAQIVGTDIKKSFSRQYTESLGATIQMRDGFGMLSFTKKLSGEASAQVDVKQTYPVEIHWTLPENKTATDYPGWTAPKNPATVILEANKKLQDTSLFPFGTKITIKEPNKPKLPGITWGEATIQVEGATPLAAEATFEITKQTAVELVVTNQAMKTRGHFAVAKKLAGEKVTLPQGYTFPISYECRSGANGRIDVPADGTAKKSAELVVGDTCTVSEGTPTQNEALKNLVWKKPEPQTVVISETSHDTPLVFTNTYTKAPAPNTQPATPDSNKPGQKKPAPNNSKKSVIAKTGASSEALALAALASLTAGTVVLLRRRRH